MESSAANAHAGAIVRLRSYLRGWILGNGDQRGSLTHLRLWGPNGYASDVPVVNGQYEVHGLQPGWYRLEAEGRRVLVARRVHLAAGEGARVDLEIG